MPFIELMMRAMTHLNIGAAIATFAWILWSGPLASIPHPTAAMSSQPSSPTFPLANGEVMP